MSVTIPSLILKQLYTFSSLENIEGGIKFSLKNRHQHWDAHLFALEIYHRSRPLV